MIKQANTERAIYHSLEPAIKELDSLELELVIGELDSLESTIKLEPAVKKLDSLELTVK